MDKDKLIERMLNETDPQKAKAIAEVVAAMEKSECDRERARMESVTEGKRILCEDRKIDADITRANAEYQASIAKVEADRLRTETEKEVSRKERILGWLKFVGTLILGFFTGFVTMRNADKVMYFEEHGTIRSKAWTGIKPDKQQDIR